MTSTYPKLIALTIISSTISPFSLSNETQAPDPVIGLLTTIKGSAVDYWPNVFNTYNIENIKVMHRYFWAGNNYLTRSSPDKNLMTAAEEQYNSAVSYAENAAYDVCLEYFKKNGISKGSVLIDNFDFTPVYMEHMSNYAYSANVMCLTKR